MGAMFKGLFHEVSTTKCGRLRYIMSVQSKDSCEVIFLISEKYIFIAFFLINGVSNHKQFYHLFFFTSFPFVPL